MAADEPNVYPYGPFALAIPGELRTGSLIFVHGTASQDADRFAFNLQTTKSLEAEGRDILLHVSPRFNENSVVRNSLLDGDWGEEERDGGLPFKRGVPFVVVFKVQEDVYKVSVDGSDFIQFAHRRASDVVRFIHMDGDVKVSMIKFQNNIPIPLRMIIGPLMEGRIIFINVVFPSDPKRFTINLMTNLGQKPDIAMQVDTHFRYGEEKNFIVVNCRGYGWGKPMYPQYFPFVPNEPFEIIIVVSDTGFVVIVDKVTVTEYSHKMVLTGETGELTIDGDGTVTAITV